MPFPFQDKTFQFETLRALGYANNGGSDANEIIELCSKIRDRNLDDWSTEWSKAGKRTLTKAKQSELKGDKISARYAFLRASNYLRTAEFFRREDPKNDEIGEELSYSAIEAFHHAMRLDERYSFNAFHVLAKNNVEISAYIITPKDQRPRPSIIVNGGFDGTKEESYLAFGVAALERGFNFIAFDGPGQGSIIREKGIAFIPEWNTVITPLVDNILTRKEVIIPDKLILIGWSMGGWLAAQAITEEHRFCGAVLNDGVFDFAAGWRKRVPQFIWTLIDFGYTNLASYLVEMSVKREVGKHWAYLNALWTFNVSNAASLLKRITQFTLTPDSAKNIQTPILILDPENDHLLGGQPVELIKRLRDGQNYTHHVFPKDEGAGEHCQMGAMGEQDRVMYGWIFELLQK